MQYPIVSEYVQAVSSAASNFDKLSHLRPVTHTDGMPVMSVGSKSVVFKLVNPADGQLYAAKCFLQARSPQAVPYERIAQELASRQSEHLLAAEYLPTELNVGGNRFPVLLTPWVDGKPLEAYVEAHLSDTDALHVLAWRFCQLAAWLLSQNIVHGNLKPSHIIVRAVGTPVLIDYDTMQFTSPGQPSPADDLPFALIALSLKAIALKPQLFTSHPNDGWLLFHPADCSPMLSAISELRSDSYLSALYQTATEVMAGNSILAQPDSPFALIDNFEPYCLNWFHQQLALALSGDAQAMYYVSKCYLDGAAVEKNQREGLRWCRLSAEAGNHYGINSLGACYRNGWGIAKDIDKANALFFEAAKLGNVYAQYNLAMAYAEGEGVDVDYSESARWYRLAAEQGDMYAQFEIALCYEQGKGVEQDYSEAVRWYRMSADQGYARAQFNLGFMYDNGYGVDQDYSEAVRWYIMSAEQGFARAQNNLGYMYEVGEGVEQDYSEAVHWYRMSAEQGYTRAQNNLGCMYETGQGVEQDYSEALRYYRMAAEQGDVQAQFQLGYMYDSGKGVDWNEEVAIEWHRLAAEAGHVGSQVRCAYYMQQIGEYEEAFKWFLAAARNGDTIAQVKLARCYMYGNGVEQNGEEAIKWLTLSANNGDRWAMSELARCYERGEYVEQDLEKAIELRLKLACDYHYIRDIEILARLYVKVHNYSEAFAWYSKIADEEPDAMIAMGEMYLWGLGVEPDEDKAKTYFADAAMKHSGKAYLLFDYYSEFGHFPAEGYADAYEWYHLLASKGEARAQFFMGVCCWDSLGCERNFAEGLRWVRLSAEQGDAYAQCQMGICYQCGLGVKQDYEEAERWLQLAAAQGDAKAADRLEHLQELLYGEGEEDEEDEE